MLSSEHDETKDVYTKIRVKKKTSSTFGVHCLLHELLCTHLRERGNEFQVTFSQTSGLAMPSDNLILSLETVLSLSLIKVFTKDVELQRLTGKK